MRRQTPAASILAAMGLLFALGCAKVARRPDPSARSPGAVGAEPVAATGETSAPASPRIVSQDVFFTAGSSWPTYAGAAGHPGFIAMALGREVVVWEAETGHLLYRVPTPAAAEEAAVAPSGGHLCVATNDGVGLFDLAAWRWRWQKPGKPGRFQVALATERACAFVEKSSGGSGATAVVLRAGDGALLSEARRSWPLTQARDLQVSADGKRALVSAEDAKGVRFQLGLWADTFEERGIVRAPCAILDEDEKGRGLTPARCPSAQSKLMLSSPDGRVGVRRDEQGSYELLRDGAPLATLVRGRPFEVGAALLVPHQLWDGKVALAQTAGWFTSRMAAPVREKWKAGPGGPGAGLWAWSLSEPAPRKLAALDAVEVGGPPSFLEPGVVSLQLGDELRRFNVESGEVLETLRAPQRGLFHPHLSEESRDAIAASTGERSALHVRGIGAAGWRELKLDGVMNQSAGYQLFRQRGAWYVAAEDELAGVFVFDAATGRRVGHFGERAIGQGGVFGLAVSPDSSRGSVAIGGPRDRGLWIFDLPGAQQPRRIEADVRQFERTLWLDDRRVALEAGSLGHALLDAVDVYDVDSAAAPAHVLFESSGPVVSFGAELFLQHLDGQAGLRLSAMDGTSEATFGTHGDGWFAYWPDRTFACAGGGCDLFRCTAGGRSEPLSACEELRRTRPLIDHAARRAGGSASH